MKKKLISLLIVMAVVLSVGLIACNNGNGGTSTEYTLTLTNGTGGTVSGGGKFKESVSVTAVATPSAGYTFEGWYDGATKITDAAATYTFSMPAKNYTLKAEFTSDTSPSVYTVTFMNGAAVFGTKNVNAGSAVSAPDGTPTKSGEFYFDGWYKALKADGTGEGEPFNFGTPINASLTLYAAFSDKAYSNVFVLDPITYKILPQKVYHGGALTLTDYHTYAYEYGDFEAYVLTLNTTFTLDVKYAFRDISGLSTATSARGGFNYEYEDTNLMLYYQQFVSANGEYTELTFGDGDYFVTYIKYGDTVLCIAEEVSDGNTYYIFQNGSVKSTYDFVETVQEGDSITLDDAFADTYAHNGILFLTAGTAVIKAEYLEVGIYINYDGNDSSWIDLIVKSGDTVDISEYNRAGYTVGSCTYSEFSQINISAAFDEVLNAQSIAIYQDMISNDVTSITDELDTIMDGNAYNGYVNGDVDSFSVNVSTGDYSYYFTVIDGKISGIISYRAAGEYYSIVFNNTTATYKVYKSDDTEFLGQVSAEQFIIHKLLDERFRIGIEYIAA